MPSPNRAIFGAHEHLTIKSAPLASLIGVRLIDAGVLAAGTYVCEVDTQGASNIDVYVEPSAANSGGTPILQSMSLNGTSTLDVVAGAPFAANTVQKLTLNGLNGTAKCQLIFTVGTSLAFTPASGHGRAEYRSL